MLKYVRIAGFVIVAMVSLSAGAKAPAKSQAQLFPEVLSYHQLMSLPPYKRVAYMRGLRAMLVELSLMSKKGRGTFVTDGYGEEEVSRESYKAMLMILGSVLPKAYAESEDYPIHVKGLSGRICSTAASMETYQILSDGRKICYPKSEHQKWLNQPSNTPTTLYHAAENEVREQEERRIQEAQRAENLRKERQSLSENPEYRRAFIDRDTTKVEAEDQRRFQEALGAVESNSQMAKGRAAQETILAGADEAKAPEVKTVAPAEAPADTAKAPTDDLFKGLPDDEQNKLCTEKLKICGEASRQEYRKKIRGGALDDFRKGEGSCISSGNMSFYKGNERKAGNCKPVNTFCYNPEDEKCAEKGSYHAGDSRKARENAASDEGPATVKDARTFICEKGSLCNPLVFGAYVKSGKGLCVASRGSDLTVKCEDEVKKLESKDPKGELFTRDILKDGGSGVANAWDDWRDNFNKTCKGGSPSQLAHCEECTVIADRLRKMNRLAMGSCDYGLNVQQLAKQKPEGAPDAGGSSPASR